MANSIILDLDEFTEPSGTIRVGGAEYALHGWGQLSLLEQKRNAKRWARVLQIEAADKITAKEQAEHDQALRDLVCDISEMTADNAADIEPEKLGRAALGFFVMRARSINEQNARMEKMLDQSIGESSSPDSTPDGPEDEPKHG